VSPQDDHEGEEGHHQPPGVLAPGQGDPGVGGGADGHGGRRRRGGRQGRGRPAEGLLGPPADLVLSQEEGRAPGAGSGAGPGHEAGLAAAPGLHQVRLDAGGLLRDPVLPQDGVLHAVGLPAAWWMLCAVLPSAGRRQPWAWRTATESGEGLVEGKKHDC